MKYLSVSLFVLISLGVLLSPANGADWRFCYPQPHGNMLHALYAPGPNELFVGGDGGLIMHWDGTDWTVMDTPSEKVIYSIDGTSSTDVWAVGGDDWTLDQAERSLVLHYDGQSWTEVTPPDYLGYTYPLGGLTALAPNNVWATNTGGPSLVRWNGTQWDFELIPLSVEGRFYKTFALDNDHLFAVGSHGQIAHKFKNKWYLEVKSETGSFSTNLLQGIWGSDLDNLYAFGNWGHVLKRQPDGSWSQVEGFTTSINHGFMTGTGTSPTNIIGIRSSNLAIYDGADTLVEPEFNTKIRGYWRNGAATTDGVFLIGNQGGVYKYYFATDTREAYMSALTAGGPPINNYNTKASSCGDNGILMCSWTQSGSHPLYYFDGTIPQKFPVVPDGMDQVIQVSAVATSVDDVTMSWATWNGYPGGIQHWDGTQWSSVSPNQRQFNEIWQSPQGTLFGFLPYLVQKLEPDRTWTELLGYNDLPQNVSIKCLWGRSDNDIYIGLNTGQVMHYNGSEWTTEDTGTTEPIWAISGTANTVYAVGTKSAAVYKKGTSWKNVIGVEQRDEDYFTDLLAVTDGVYAAMTTGRYESRLYKFANGQATIEFDRYTDPIQSMAKTSTGEVYLVLATGDIMTSAPKPQNRFGGLVDTDSSQWYSLRNTGLSIKSTEARGKQYLTAWRVDSAPNLFMPTPGETFVPAGQQWVALQDQPREGPVFGNALVRVQSDPDKRPSGLTPEQMALYRNDSNAWKGVSTLVDPVAGTFQTRTGTGLSAWTISRSPDFTGPLTPIELVDLIYEYENETADYKEIFRRMLKWMEIE